MPALVDRRFRSWFVNNRDGTIVEYDATTCVHGNEIIVREPGHEGINWDFCMRCMGPICLKCARKMARTGECVAFERALQQMESVTRLPRIERELAHVLPAAR